MGIWENVLLAIAGLRANRMRALLTMLGIIIGISAVITISTLGSVMQSFISGAFSDLVTMDSINVYSTQKPDPARNYYLEEDDYSIECINDMADRFSDDISAYAISAGTASGTVSDGKKSRNINIKGVNEYGIKADSFKMLKGRNVSAEDIEKYRQVCVISNRQAKTLFGSVDNALGKTFTAYVKSDNKSSTMRDYTIIGIYEYKMPAIISMLVGGRQDNDWNSDVYAPYSTICRETNTEVRFYYFTVYAKDANKAPEVAQKIKEYFDETFYANNDSYMCYTEANSQQLDQINNVLNIVKIVMSVIAAISLLVGGIGVMNIMLVSVTERTREIGVRKALGAPNSAIRIQFIVESVIICLIGGIIGITIGVSMGMIASIIAKATIAPPIFTVIVAMGFSMLIGVFFGYYPANKAAKLDPIEALRYE